jgi:hypothetical protein
MARNPLPWHGNSCSRQWAWHAPVAVGARGHYGGGLRRLSAIVLQLEHASADAGALTAARLTRVASRALAPAAWHTRITAAPRGSIAEGDGRHVRAPHSVRRKPRTRRPAEWTRAVAAAVQPCVIQAALQGPSPPLL